MDSATTVSISRKRIDWYSRVHFMDHARNGLRQCRCRKGRAQHNVVEWHDPLPCTTAICGTDQVKLGSCFLINAPLLDILRHSDDGEPRQLIVAARLYALPDWVSPFPERLGELLVHDGDRPRGRGIALAESCARVRSGCPSSRNSRASRTDSNQRHGTAPPTEPWCRRPRVLTVRGGRFGGSPDMAVAASTPGTARSASSRR